MKMRFRKTVLFVMAVSVLLSLNGCAVFTPDAPTELPDPSTVPTVDPHRIAELEARLALAEDEHSSYAFLAGAAVNGKTVVPLDGETTLSVDAAVPEGMKLAQWTVNGVSLNTLSEHIELTVKENSVIKAEYRPIKKVTCINCSMQFLDYYEDGGGESFTEFVFEDDYINTYTGAPCEGGSVLLCVTVLIPPGKKIDHWLVNGQSLGVKYTPNVFNAYVTESTTFEPVFADISY